MVECSKIIAIGTSAGGVNALTSLVAALPKHFPVPILVVLHVGSHRSELPGLLTSAGQLPALHPKNGQRIEPGQIYVAPPDYHMIVAGSCLRLSRGPKENCARPAIDPLFRSVAETYGPAAIGVILTGNLADGALGLFEISRRGGIAIVQCRDDAAYPEMPRNAARLVEADYNPRLADLPKLLIELAIGKDGKEKTMSAIPTPHNPEKKPAMTEGTWFERPVAITCPDCGGALKRTEVGPIVKFGCHIGHAYTAETIAIAHFEKMERMMRAAVRFLNERAEFCLQMAERSYAGEPELATSWQAASRQAMDRAYKLRDLVEQDWITPEGFVSTQTDDSITAR